ncbi:hypothetical protein [Oleiharenicola sp. Vm1]|uniref:hypothetical protein n=1 Tax=Oleiharenicola sp. Vm1 TaxID=3398393 RepID=UPI0039F5269C
MNPSANLLTVSGILLGFLFAGFWWILNREVKFKPEERHFKLCYWLIFASMAALALFGVLLPLHRLIGAGRWDRMCGAGVAAAIVLAFGYMFGELGHYGVFVRPHYITRAEKTVVIAAALAAVAAAIAFACLR